MLTLFALPLDRDRTGRLGKLADECSIFAARAFGGREQQFFYNLVLSSEIMTETICSIIKLLLERPRHSEIYYQLFFMLLNRVINSKVASFTFRLLQSPTVSASD